MARAKSLLSMTQTTDGLRPVQIGIPMTLLLFLLLSLILPIGCVAYLTGHRYRPDGRGLYLSLCAWGILGLLIIMGGSNQPLF